MAEILRSADLDFEVNGLEVYTLPHVFSVRFPGVSIEPLLMNLDMDGIAVSSGSVCMAGKRKSFDVFKAFFLGKHPAA
ncbi:hypothetical protein AWI84_15600 [Listeria monocytogenes]|nr:hypothetical protein AWI84_15600 [Listeria monocytogenes]